MSIEQQLKEYILSRYKSIREFCIQGDFPYSTVDNIFKRGLMGSSVSIVMRVCKKLGLDVDELANGRIAEKRNETNRLSSHEELVIQAYRSNPTMKSAVDKLLGIDEGTGENIHIVKIAARGGDFKEVALTDSELEKIKKEINNLPDVDDL